MLKKSLRAVALFSFGLVLAGTTPAFAGQDQGQEQDQKTICTHRHAVYSRNTAGVCLPSLVRWKCHGHYASRPLAAHVGAALRARGLEVRVR